MRQKKKDGAKSGNDPSSQFRGGTGRIEDPFSGNGGKTHRGLPLLKMKEYKKFYGIQPEGDAAAMSDFVGYVEDFAGNIRYVDATAVNALVGGIHVGIDGLISHEDALSPPKGPEDVGEYVLYIVISPSVQKKLRVVCTGENDCISAASFFEREKDIHTREEIENKLHYLQDKMGYIVTKLPFEPKTDPDARKRVTLLALAINQYLREESPLEELKAFVDAACSRLQSMSGLPDPMTVAEEDAGSLWEDFWNTLKIARSPTS